jgi:hypothetical protein
MRSTVIQRSLAERGGIAALVGGFHLLVGVACRRARAAEFRS